MRNRKATNSADVIFTALSDPTRRAVLDLLRGGTLPAGEIAGVFPVSRPAVSKHLRLLRRARLVTETRRSRHRLYSLDPTPLKAVDTWLNQYRVFWAASLTSLKSVVENEKSRKIPVSRRKPT
ncbi:MAG: ArsR/SmtB family transcription factor [Terracidiphilus sp.]